MRKIDLQDMVGGALNEKFQNSLKRVMENMQDVNTPYKDKREINIKMTFVQNEARDNVMAEIKVTEKLASQAAMATQFDVGKDLRTGEVYAEEYGKQLKGQISMDQEEPETEGIAEGNGIVDFRKAR